MVGTVGTVGTIGRQHIYVWKGFCHYEPEWSPIQELVEVGVTYSQITA